MSNWSLESSSDHCPIRRRTRRDPKPHFKPDRTDQLDAIVGCPALQVPTDHLARIVWGVVEHFDLSGIEARYSSLGRRGYSPRNLLAVWIYASLVGLHHATEVARQLHTDAAFRLLSGEHTISRQTLNRFRASNGKLFESAINQTVKMAETMGLLPLEDLALDSMRLRAHASSREIRTLARSTKRVEELRATDTTGFSDEERVVLGKKIEKHERVIAQCQTHNVTNFVTTNEAAALIKFPEGNSAPGHRITAVAVGMRERFILTVLVTADTTDYDLLKPAVEKVLTTLNLLGIDQKQIQMAADAGYCSQTNLELIERLRQKIDILVDAGRAPGRHESRFFSRECFDVHDDNTAHCPAGRRMHGPRKRSGKRLAWFGVDCGSCHLKSQCTDGVVRTVEIQPELDRLRGTMAARLATDEGKHRYRRRMATIEPVFSYLESVMNFRRASSRKRETILAEVALKVLAYNVSRLLAARRLLLVYCLVTEKGLLVPLQIEF